MLSSFSDSRSTSKDPTYNVRLRHRWPAEVLQKFLLSEAPSGGNDQSLKMSDPNFTEQRIKRLLFLGLSFIWAMRTVPMPT